MATRGIFVTRGMWMKLRKDQKKLIADVKKSLKRKPRNRIEAMIQALLKILLRKYEESVK